MSTVASSSTTNNNKNNNDEKETQEQEHYASYPTEDHALPRTSMSSVYSGGGEHEPQAHVPAQQETPRSHGYYTATNPVYQPHEQFPQDSYGGMDPNSYAVSQPAPAWLFQRLKSQVEFYFSYENLVRDDFMVQQLLMHGGNAIPCLLVGNFPRVREILGGGTASPELLYEALQYSLVVRVYGTVLVPLTDALQQALHVRRQPTSLQPPPHQQPHPSLDLSSRYSPTTTSVTDDTTASSQATTPKEAPLPPPVGFQTLPTQGFYPSQSTTAQQHLVVEPQPKMMTTSSTMQASPQASVYWPIESPNHHQQQPPYGQVYNSYNSTGNDSPQVVPYGYTVTTAATVSPETSRHEHETNKNQAPQPHHSQRHNSYNNYKKKNNYRHKKRYSRQQQQQQQQKQEKDLNQHRDSDPTKQERTFEVNKPQDSHPQQLHDQDKNNNKNDDSPNQSHDHPNQTTDQSHPTPQDSDKDPPSPSVPSSSSQPHKQTRKRYWNKSRGGGYNHYKSSWTKDDFPVLHNHSRNKDGHKDQKNTEKKHNNNHKRTESGEEVLTGGMKGLSLQEGKL